MVKANFVHLLFHRNDRRGMSILPFATRCVQKGEIHEVLTTDQRQLRSGDKVNRTGFLGFVEMGVSGVLECGDKVTCNGKILGTIAGFDGCHLPNHLNIIIEATRVETGRTLDLDLNAQIKFLGSDLDKHNFNKIGDDYDEYSSSSAAAAK